MQTSNQLFNEFNSIVHGAHSMFSWVVLNHFDELQGEKEEYCHSLWNTSTHILLLIRQFNNAMEKNQMEHIELLRTNIWNGMKRFISLLREDHHTFAKELPIGFHDGYDKLMDFSRKMEISCVV
jgi:hypothetical protein